MNRTEEIKNRLEKAKAESWVLLTGEYELRINNDLGDCVAAIPLDDEISSAELDKAQAELMAAAPADIRYLLDELAKLREQIKKCRDEALEEAAKRCDEEDGEWDPLRHMDGNVVVRFISKSIRTLKTSS